MADEIETGDEAESSTVDVFEEELAEELSALEEDEPIGELLSEGTVELKPEPECETKVALRGLVDALGYCHVAGDTSRYPHSKAEYNAALKRAFEVLAG